LGLNHLYWEKIFEAALRLNANTIWSATWDRDFWDDDPISGTDTIIKVSANQNTATQYGIVMATSHEAPMGRGIEEWNRRVTSTSDPWGGNGQWTYSSNSAALKKYWTEGIQRMVDQNIEEIITVGMRGTGDTALPASEGISVMTDLLAAQQDIITEVTGKSSNATPQAWALYKEVPLSFFLDYAWNPESIPADRIQPWLKQWTKEQFGPTHSDTIADILHRYSLLASDRKPEQTNQMTTKEQSGALSPFSLNNYREMENQVADWKQLAADADAIRQQLPAEQQDAFYELVYYEVKATSVIYNLRLNQFKNISIYNGQGRAATNDLRDAANADFAELQAMNDYYNTTLAGGKWYGWQTQPVMGYTSWQQPEDSSGWATVDSIQPALKSLTLSASSVMGVAIDGSSSS
jgi:hypothetical protein